MSSSNMKDFVSRQANAFLRMFVFVVLHSVIFVVIYFSGYFLLSLMEQFPVPQNQPALELLKKITLYGTIAVLVVSMFAFVITELLHEYKEIRETIRELRKIEKEDSN